MDVKQTKTTRSALFVCSLGLVASGCGSAGSVDETTDSFNASEFVGTFTVVNLTAEGEAIPLTGLPTIVVDDIAASLAADTGCNTHLGSYSFFDDGTLSVTLTGGTRRQCEAFTELQDSSITEALGEVDRWASPAPTSIVMSTPDGDMLELQRQ